MAADASPSDMSVGPSGFWGLILEPGKRYTKLADTLFHLTAAVLDTTSSGDEEDDIVSVLLEVDGTEMIICNLSLKEGILQVPLNLKFGEGSRISFYSNAVSSSIHLSGNVIATKGNNSLSKKDKFVQEKRKLDVQGVGASKKAKKQTEEEVRRKIFESLAEAEDDDEDDDDEEDDDDDDDDDDDGEDEEEESDSYMFSDEEEEEIEEEEEEEKEIKVSKSKKGGSASPSSTKEKSPKTQVPVQSVQPKSKKEKKAEKAAMMNGKQAKKNATTNSPKEIAVSPKAAAKSPKVHNANGVLCEDLVVGSGQLATHGNRVSVYYEGRLQRSNKMFDRCQAGKPFKFRLGAKDIIQGWNHGVKGMKVGGKRKIVCPPHLAYGNAGAPPDIPPNSPLVFVIELKGVS